MNEYDIVAPLTKSNHSLTIRKFMECGAISSPQMTYNEPFMVPITPQAQVVDHEWILNRSQTFTDKRQLCPQRTQLDLNQCHGPPKDPEWLRTDPQRLQLDMDFQWIFSYPT